MNNLWRELQTGPDTPNTIYAIVEIPRGSRNKYEYHQDAKILAVATHDPMHKDYFNITDIPQHYVAEISHFFQVYKDLEGSSVEVMGWEDVAQAKEEIVKAQQLYEARFGFKSI